MHDLKKDFLDAPELAHLLNRSLATIHLYRKTDKIPKPTARLNTVYLWDRKEIENWYREEHNYQKLSKRYASGKYSRAVIATNIKDGSIIEYESMAEAHKDGFFSSNISLCCNGKTKQHKGYKWSFKDVS